MKRILAARLRKCGDIWKIDENILNDFGFKFLGRGGFRIGFRRNNIVVKIGKTYPCNEEMYFYRKIQKHPILRYTFIPIFSNTKIDDKYSMMISAFGESRSCNKSYEFKNRELQNQRNIFCEIYKDAYPNNLKIFGSYLVMIDCNIGLFNFKEKSVKNWKNSINFKKHVKEYEEKKEIARLEYEEFIK